MKDWKQTPCGMVVMVDGGFAKDLSGKVYRRVGKGKKFVNLDGTPIKHNTVMHILARGRE